MKRQLDLGKFHKLARARTTIPDVCIRLASTNEPAVDVSARVATFVFSDSSVDRYGDMIDARGWVLDKFMANPVALFGHDSGSVENVIGRARNVHVEGERLVGEIEFMEASVNPTAETVFQMVKGGYLNAVSVGFAPLEWSLAKDKSRPQGIDFKKQELLEISIVPIPANPAALVQARAAGIEVDRLAFYPPHAATVCMSPSLIDMIALRENLSMIEKAGKVLSADNEMRLRDAHAQIIQGCDIIMGVIVANQPTDNGDDNEVGNDPDDHAREAADARARRERIIRAHKLKIVAVV